MLGVFSSLHAPRIESDWFPPYWCYKRRYSIRLDSPPKKRYSKEDWDKSWYQHNSERERGGTISDEEEEEGRRGKKEISALSRPYRLLDITWSHFESKSLGGGSQRSFDLPSFICVMNARVLNLRINPSHFPNNPTRAEMTRIHALTMKTWTPKQYEEKKAAGAVW